MLRCSDTGRQWAGRRVQRRSTRGAFVGERCVCGGQLPALAQPIRRGLAHGVKGRAVSELGLRRL